MTVSISREWEELLEESRESDVQGLDAHGQMTDALLRGVEGEVLDGKYKILKVGETSVIVSYVDGTGQRTIRIG